MFILTNPIIGILFVLCAMLCGGFWALPMKMAAETSPSPSLGFLDQALAMAVHLIIISLTFGNYGQAIPTFSQNFAEFDWVYALYPFGSGLIQAVGCHLILEAQALIGVALAFPIAVGITNVLGSVWTYNINPVGNPYFLFGGVGMAIAAVCVGSVAGRVKESSKKDAMDPTQVDEATPLNPIIKNYESQTKEIAPSLSLRSSSVSKNSSSASLPRHPLSRTSSNVSLARNVSIESVGTTKRRKNDDFIKGIILCVLCGLFWAGWDPIALLGQGEVVDGVMEDRTKLVPYGTLFWMGLGYLLGVMITGTILLYYPIGATQKPGSLWDYTQFSFMEHALPVVSGILLAFIQFFNTVGGGAAGYAISFGLLASNPIITATAGVLFFHELRGTVRLFKILFLGMIGCYICSIFLVVLSAIYGDET